VPALSDVLDSLARAVLPTAALDGRLGDVTLRPHQIAAVEQIEMAFEEFGGALLADDPGLGKTFVALALARRFPRTVVAAPASLRAMWLEASRQAAVRIEFVSLEELSRGHAPKRAALLIVDEAHRASTESAQRYAQLATLAQEARVLLISANPVRNRREEFDALLALFLGVEGRAASEATVARCTIRRTTSGVSAVLPRIVQHPPYRPRGGSEIARALLALPVPAVLADGAAAVALVRTSLARAWASSIAALDRAIWRRLMRGTAIADTLDAGRLPTRAELASWAVGDDAMQMAFPFMATSSEVSIHEARAAVLAHSEALRELRVIVRKRLQGDTKWRSSHLRRIVRNDPAAVVIAFTGSEATAAALFGALRAEHGVVLLTGQGARSAVGPLDRSDVIRSLGADHARPIRARRASDLPHLRLVIATDLLAEGVNLQRASAIVHLDDPWTPSAVRQRVGRSARLGSTHAAIDAFRFAPPLAAEELLELPRRHAEKARAEASAVASGEAAEAIRRTVEAWRQATPTAFPSIVAAAVASSAGLIARIESRGRARLVCGVPRGPRQWTISDNPGTLSRMLGAVTVTPLEAPMGAEVAAASQALLGWVERDSARAMTGVHAAPSPARRRLLARLDACVAKADSMARPAVSARVSSLRAMLGTARGAGIELRFEVLLARDSRDPRWLDEVEAHLSVAHPDAAERPLQFEVTALLFLRVPSAAAPPGPSPAPRAASTETAAPR
jgi:hypothetical protein